MRIAISGSAGTGKTSLATHLSRYLSYPLVPEGIREYLLEHKLQDLRSMTPSQTMGMQWTILNRKVEIEKNLKDFVSDRSTADNVSYTLRWCARSTLEIPRAEIKHFINVAKKHCELYDIVFVLPGGIIPLHSDGVRSINENYQYEMECMIMGVLHKWDMPFYIVDANTIEERIEQCQETINLRGRLEYGVFS